MSEELPADLRRAAADPGVLGLVLTGSQARQGMATGRSDVDVYAIVAPDAADRWSTTRTPELDTIVMTIDEFSTGGATS